MNLSSPSLFLLDQGKSLILFLSCMIWRLYVTISSYLSLSSFSLLNLSSSLRNWALGFITVGLSPRHFGQNHFPFGFPENCASEAFRNSFLFNSTTIRCRWMFRKESTRNQSNKRKKESLRARKRDSVRERKIERQIDRDRDTERERERRRMER